MFSNLFKFFKKNDASANAAKDRLKLVLVSDRTACSPEIMEQIKNDIIEVLAKYVEVDQENLNVELSKQNEGVAICANIPLNSSKRVSALKEEGECKEVGA